jgi:glucose-6-phosphate 1-dehydrogenase
MQVKQPGLEMSTVQSELDLSYRQRYHDVTIPEAYERLILDTYVTFPNSYLRHVFVATFFEEAMFLLLLNTSLKMLKGI